MLSVEQEPIRLPSILTEIDGPDGRTLKIADKRNVVLPRRFQFLWDQTKLGASIYELCLRLRARGDSDRVFLEVAAYLCFLVDHDMIDDVRLVRLADSIRGEYQWPEDLITSFAASGEIASWGRRSSLASRGSRSIPLTSKSFDFLSSVWVFLSIPFTFFLCAVLFDAGEIPNFNFGLLFVGGLLLAGSIGRTGTAVFRSFASSIGGDGGSLYWKIDLLGPHLLFEPQTVTGSFRRLCDFVLCFGAATIPLVLNVFGKTGSRGSLVILFGSLFVVALTTHPATRNGLTRSLRIWNRAPRAWREDDELQEVEFFHRFGGGISVFIAALFFGGVIAAVLKVRPDALFIKTHFAASTVFIVAFFIALVAYVEPFFKFDLPGSARRNKRLRLWGTRNKILHVAAADREAWNELPILRQLTTPIRRQLITAARVTRFRAGQAVCRQGDSDRSLYIVLDGKLGIAKSFENRRRKVVAILSPGAVFGETAFFFGHLRTADVVAMDDCRLLEIPFLPSMQNLDISTSEEFQFRVWLLQALSGNSMLKELPSEAMDTLIFAGARKKFRAGEAVFTEGAPATTCYFIAQGRVSVVQQGRKISELGAGEAFGEIALLKASSRRTASVVADSDVLCMELDVDSFWALLASRLPLGAEIERLALRRLRADEQRRQS